MNTKAAVEALLFLSDKPLRAQLIAFLLQVDIAPVRDAVSQLQQEYASSQSAFTIRSINSIESFDQLLTEDDFTILDKFDPTENLQNVCPITTSFLSAPTFDTYVLDTVTYSASGWSEPLSVFKPADDVEQLLEQNYRKLQTTLISFRQDFSQSLKEEKALEEQLQLKWQTAGDNTAVVADMQLEWESKRALNRHLREELLDTEKHVQRAYVNKQNALAFARVSLAVAQAKKSLSSSARKRLVSFFCKLFSATGLKARIEALLFHTSDDFTLDELADLLSEAPDVIQQHVEQLKVDHEKRNSPIQIHAVESYSMRLKCDFLELPFLRGVPQTADECTQLVDRLHECRMQVLLSAEQTNIQVETWHEAAKGNVRTNDETTARKALTYWYFCKEHFDSLNQFADGFDLVIARLSDLQDRLNFADDQDEVIAIQHSITSAADSSMEHAIAAIEKSRDALKTLDELIQKSKNHAVTWGRRARLAAEMHNEELERQALERQRIYESSAVEIEQQSLQALTLHEFISEATGALLETAGMMGDEESSSEYFDGDSSEFDVLDLRDFHLFSPKVGQLAISNLIKAQTQHLMSFAIASMARSQTYISEESLQNRAEHLTLQLAQLESMLSETKVDWRSLGPNPFMEMAAQVENELALLKETEC